MKQEKRRTDFCISRSRFCCILKANNFDTFLLSILANIHIVQLFCYSWHHSYNHNVAHNSGRTDRMDTLEYNQLFAKSANTSKIKLTELASRSGPSSSTCTFSSFGITSAVMHAETVMYAVCSP